MALPRHRGLGSPEEDGEGLATGDAPPLRARGSEDSLSEADEPMDDVREDNPDEAQLVKKMVRYALACEYSRTPIRRDGIKEKVLGTHGRAFRRVFEGAQKQLVTIFGMDMVEMPVKDRSVMSLDQKRKAGKAQSQAQTTSNAYMLVSTLPTPYRNSAILGPSMVQSPQGEAAYVGLYSTLITAITLSGGELSDARFRRYLQRLVIDKTMPSLNPNNENHSTEATEVVLQRMIRQGYLIKVTDNTVQDGRESVTWHVGPRGKMEVGNETIAGITRQVYGGSSAELEEKLRMSLKVGEQAAAAAAVNSGASEDVADSPHGGGEKSEVGRPGGMRRSRRRRAEDDSADGN